MKKLLLILFLINTIFCRAQFSSELVVNNNSDGVSGIELCDMDNDGDLDILTASLLDNTVAWHENLGNNVIDTVKNIVSLSLPNAFSVKAADLDNDLDNDVVVATGGGNELVWFENLGGGIMDTTKKVILNGLYVRDIFIVDLDMDGYKDVLTALTNDDKIAWHKNLGGTIDTNYQIISSVLNNAWRVYAADLDGDNDPDVICPSEGFDKVVWHENLGSGNISSAENVISSATLGARSAFAADIDNDGDLDVLVASQADNTVGWCENLGGGVFGPRQIISTQHNYLDYIEGADIDNDGDIDVIAVSTFDNKLAWYENLGSGTFGVQQVVSTMANNPRMAASGDLDNDGDVDLVLASTGNDMVYWYENYIINHHQLIGKVFYDLNQNAILDTNEIGLSFIKMQLTPTGLANFTANNGTYFFGVNDTATNYTVSYVADSLWNLSTDSANYTKSLSLNNPIADSLDFGFFPDTILTVLNPDLTGAFPRCNTIVNYWINIQNLGTTLPSGTIHLQLDDSITYFNSALVPDSIIGQNIYWHYDDLFFFLPKIIDLQVIMPDFNSIGDTLVSYLMVNELDSFGSGTITYSNADTLEQTLVCAYDPNDKSVSPKGIGTEGFVNPNLKMEYLVRFQNTGNDTAITVIIRDQLDENLDWSTLQLISSSDPVQIWIEQNGEAVFKFENIMLPDSNVDFLSSQGYVKYSIEQWPNLLPNTEIFNTAEIYFDYNPVVITNTVLNTIECYGVPNPTITFNFSYLDCGVTGNYSYQWYLNGSEILGATTDTLEPFSSGNYSVIITDTNSCEVESDPFNFIITNINSNQSIYGLIYPNPFNESTTILFNKNLNKVYDLMVYNIIGAEVYRENKISGNQLKINKNDIGKGLFLTYLINNQTGERIFIEKLIIQ